MSVLSTQLSVCLSLHPTLHSSILPSTHTSVAPYNPPSIPPSLSLCLSLPSSFHPSIYSSMPPFLQSSIPPSVTPSIPPSIPLSIPPSLPPLPPYTTRRRHQLPPERTPWGHRGVCSSGGKQQGGFGCFLAPNSANDGADLAAPGSPEVIFGVKSCASLPKLKKKVDFVALGISARGCVFEEVVQKEKKKLIIIIPFPLHGTGIDGAGRDCSQQTPGEGGGESMATSFVTNQKYGIIGFPANRELKKQIHHLGHGRLLLLGHLGHLGTAKPRRHLAGTLNLVGNPTAASKPKSSSSFFSEINYFSPFCPPQTYVFPAKSGREGLGRIVGFQMGKFKTVLIFQRSSITLGWDFFWISGGFVKGLAFSFSSGETEAQSRIHSKRHPSSSSLLLSAPLISPGWDYIPG